MAYRWNPGFGDIQFNSNLANQGFTAGGLPALPSGSPAPGYTWLLTPSGRTGQVLTQTLVDMGWGFSAYPNFYDSTGTVFLARENQFDTWMSTTPVQSGVQVPANWTGSTPANPANTPPPTQNVVTSSGVPPQKTVTSQQTKRNAPRFDWI